MIASPAAVSSQLWLPNQAQSQALGRDGKLASRAGINKWGCRELPDAGCQGAVLAAGVALRWVQLLVLDLRVSLWIKRSRVSDNRVSGLRIRTDEGLSKEAVPTVHPWKNGGAVCACNSTIIPLGAALPAASLSACLLGAS